MEILSFNPKSMKEIIDGGTLISDAGFSSTVFLHGTNLIKLHKNLYHYLKINSKTFAENVFKDVYMWDKTPFVSIEQIEYLQNKQKQVHLTEFDRGVVLVNDQVCGSLLTPHLDYKDLTEYSLEDVSSLLKILKNILLALRELEINGISHLDLVKGEKNKEPTLNVLYKGTDIKLCDLSGKYITYGDKFNPQEMYREYSDLLQFLLKKLGISALYSQTEELTNYEQSMLAFQELEKRLIK